MPVKNLQFSGFGSDFSPLAAYVGQPALPRINIRWIIRGESVKLAQILVVSLSKVSAHFDLPLP